MSKKKEYGKIFSQLLYNTLIFYFFQDILYRKVDILKIVGIVAEFNPLHNGHKYLLERARKHGDVVVTVISSNFVQRGEPSVISKFERAKTAVLCGSDICIELPTPWSMSTAQNFAYGAISQLSKFKINTLVFGSECGNIDALLKICNVLESREFNLRIKNNINDGTTYAKLRQNILNEFLGGLSDILSNPNDTLAIEYILAARKLKLNIDFVPIKRVGTNHNDPFEKDEFSSSTLLRKALKTQNTEYFSKYMPKESLDVLLNSNHSDIEKLNTAIMSNLKLKSSSNFNSLPDISEGIEKRLFEACKECTDYDDLCEKIKTKRYTLARIRRLVLSAFLGIDNSLFLKEVPYARVLATNNNGLEYIASVKNKNIVLQVSEIKKLDEMSRELFNLECKISDVYNLSLCRKEPSGSDFKNGLIKI